MKVKKLFLCCVELSHFQISLCNFPSLCLKSFSRICMSQRFASIALNPGCQIPHPFARLMTRGRKDLRSTQPWTIKWDRCLPLSYQKINGAWGPLFLLELLETTWPENVQCCVSFIQQHQLFLCLIQLSSLKTRLWWRKKRSTPFHLLKG